MGSVPVTFHLISTLISAVYMITILENNAIVLIWLFAIVFTLMLIWVSVSQQYKWKLQEENKRLSLQLIKRDDAINVLSTEKEWLVEELHHRVKNNLQLVVSLLNTQAMYLDNDEAKRVFRKSRHRLFALSLVHQKLYQGKELSAIDISQYLTELVEYLNDEYNPNDRVTFSIKAVPLYLHVNMAVPLGLIINEAVSNAFKYAFPDNRSGHVSVSLSRSEKGLYRLEIADNGIGGDVLLMQQNETTLGKSLMRGLSDQMRAVLDIDNTDGVMVRVDFPVDELQSCA